MGTNGLWSYRYRHRYWTTFNQYDSYPEGLGAELVSAIPADPEEFRQWLEALKAELDERHAQGEKFDTEPPQMVPFIEWTYVIDLDRNVFTINGAHHVRLDEPPRDDCAWTVALDLGHPASLELHDAIPPKAEHLALYDAVQASQTLAVPAVELPFATCGVLMTHLFRNFCAVYYARVLGQERPDQQSFAAAAGVIVALATWGQFALDSRMFEPSPRFTRQAPAWVRAATHFWHRGTLFVLDSGLEENAQLRGAVGRAVALWRKCTDPRKRGAAFVLSLRELVLVELAGATVRHTAPVLLVPKDTDDDGDSFNVARPSVGFALLMAHMTPALPATTPAELPMPEEVLERVLDWCDDETLVAVGETCKTLRTMYLHRPRLTVGRHRLLHHTSDGDFTALDRYRDTVHVRASGLDADDGGKAYAVWLSVPRQLATAPESTPFRFGLRCKSVPARARPRGLRAAR